MHQHLMGLAEGLPAGEGERKEWRGSELPDVNSMQTRAFSVLLVVAAVPVAGSST